MDLPGILSPDLKNLAEASHDKELYDQLLVSTERLTRFFSFAADDETWSAQHGEFYKLVLAWFTRQYLQDRIKESYLHAIILSFQEHYSILESFLPRPVTLKMGDAIFPVNPIVMGFMSPYLKSLLKKEIQEKNARTIEIPEAPLELVQVALHYMESASAEGLWKFEKPVLLKLQELAEKWGVAGLAKECQEVLMRYINQDNVQNELLLSIKKGRWVLLERCKAVFNEKFVDGRILTCDESSLIFEFVNFDERAFLAFDCIKSLVTHLCFKGNLTLNEQFAKVMGQAPKLIGLILSETNEWSPFFPEIPQKVYSLDVSKCAWLGDGELRLLLNLLPKISILNLSENTQITYRGFAELKNLYGLKSLSLEKCFQLENDGLNLILQGAGGLAELNLHGCRKLSDGSFNELGKRTPHLKKLVLSRTTITDGGLVDICFKCQELTELELDHCLNITEAGLFDCVRIAKQLKMLSIRENKFDSKAVRDVRKQYPDIVIDED
jgi:hypothetical protein